MNPLLENGLVLLIVGGAVAFMARRLLGKRLRRRGTQSHAGGRGSHSQTACEDGCSACPSATMPGGGCSGCG